MDNLYFGRVSFPSHEKEFILASMRSIYLPNASTYCESTPVTQIPFMRGFQQCLSNLGHDFLQRTTDTAQTYN